MSLVSPQERTNVTQAVSKSKKTLDLGFVFISLCPAPQLSVQARKQLPWLLRPVMTDSSPGNSAQPSRITGPVQRLSGVHPMQLGQSELTEEKVNGIHFPMVSPKQSWENETLIILTLRNNYLCFSTIAHKTPTTVLLELWLNKQSVLTPLKPVSSLYAFPLWHGTVLWL